MGYNLYSNKKKKEKEGVRRDTIKTTDRSSFIRMDLIRLRGGEQQRRQQSNAVHHRDLIDR